MDHLCYLCLVFAMLSSLFIAALWSPAVKALISWLLALFCDVKLCFCPLRKWHPWSGVVLDCNDS